MNVVSKWDGAGGAGVSWYLAVRSTGQLYLQWNEGGLTRSALSTIPTGLADGTRKWIRATLDVDNGAGGRDVKFYLSDDYNPDTRTGTWSQLGLTLTSAGVTSITDTPGAVTIGTRDHGVAGLFAGKIYYVDVRNGIDGATVVRFNPSADAGSSNGTNFTSSTGELWTLAGAATLNAGAQDQVDTFAFDAAGRTLQQIQAFGTADAATTRYVLDAFGNRTTIIDPRGVELAESDSAWALQTRKALGYGRCRQRKGVAALYDAREIRARRALQRHPTVRRRGQKDPQH
jgi:YD repeat-containing protein